MARTPQEIAEAAVTWRVENEGEWFFLANEAIREARYRGWASIHNAADRTRMDRNIRIPNSIKPALSRMLVIEFPELEEYLRQNKAGVDEVDFYEIYDERGLEYAQA